MRLSLRKVVKLTTFLLLFMLLNVWISYSVNFWSFNNFDDRGKVLPTLRRSYPEDNGGARPLPPVNQDVVKAAETSHLEAEIFRNQRSAKAFDTSKLHDSLQLQNGVYDDQHMALVAENTGDKGDNLLIAKNGEKKDAETHSNLGLNQQNNVKQTEETELKDVYISVKTTSKYHESRVKLLLRTWYLLAREQIYFFTDATDPDIEETLGDHLVNTNCSTDHSRRALSCKMAVEFDYYMASRKRWFCHVDDDVYLNVPRLVELLKKYNHKEDWYLGKPSLKHPLEVLDRDNPGMKLTFWFATGGAGFCISRSLALKMVPYAGGGRFMTTAETIRLPDDCTVGYIIEHLLKQRLTVVDEFHSHLEALWLIKSHHLEKQITLSFSEYSGKQNVINIQGFSQQDDPTRLKSLHCHLFPNFRECRVLS